MNMIKTKLANWNAPQNITALTTTRIGGCSQAPYDSNNLALHVGDNEKDVQKNRQQLSEVLKLPNEPVWLEQTHTNLCIVAENDTNRNVDAAVTRSMENPLVILTADCLPITLSNKQGTEIAAIHAGWRGLYNGIIENSLKKMLSSSSDLLAWIVPAISLEHFEVRDEVYHSFTSKYSSSALAFKPVAEKKWLANLALIAECVLHSVGIKAVWQSNLCTFKLKNEFYSYRREPQTGRIATLIWFNDQPQE